jgi:hypothetical protein
LRRLLLAHAHHVNNERSERGLLLVACGLALLWLLQDWSLPSISGVAACCAAAIALLAALVFFGLMPAWGVLIGCVATSAIVRATVTPVIGSDVLMATEEAIQVTLHHYNPYTHYYIFTRPPGQPFPYLPGSLLFYWLQAIVTHSSLTDRWSGIGTVVALALFAPACGWARTAIAVAFFGLCPLLVMLSVDGSNDTSLTFLSVIAIVLLIYASRTSGTIRRVLFAGSAIAFGWGIAFKAFSWVLFPFISRCVAADARRLVFLIALGIAALMIAPAPLADPSAFLRSVRGGAESHTEVWGFNVWAALPNSFSPGPAFVTHARQLAAAVALLAAIALWWLPSYKTLFEAIVAPILILVVAFLLAPWSSLAYYSYCLGLGAAAFTVFRLERRNW